jgi:hypothetical protein
VRFIFVMLLAIAIAGGARAADRYFPPSSLSQNPKSDEFREAWYSSELKGMGEKPLWPAASEGEVYGLTWLRSFHRPMSFRLNVLDDGSGLLTSRESARVRGELIIGDVADWLSSPVIITQSKEVELSKEFVNRFKDRLEGINFWNMPHRVGNSGLDGSTWIFEGTQNGNHHFTSIWTPGGTQFSDVMLELMKQSGLQLGEVY